MIRRLIARVAAWRRRTKRMPDSMDGWRAWQDEEFYERLRRGDPLP
jgi:hypothetical protein